MAKIITKWWAVFGLILLVGVYGWGVKNMFFHQDDLDWFILANRSWAGVMSAPIGDHVNYVWRVLLKLEWDTFHLHFEPYLAVSLILHAGVTWLLYKLAKLSSGREDLALSAASLFVINTNWTETILWISGQTITITALLVLLAMLAIWQKKQEGIALLLASWTSALAIGVLGASVLVFKKLRWQTLGVILVLGLIYKLWATDGTSIAFSLQWVLQVGVVWGLMLINSVIGRVVVPFDRFETIRIAIISLLMVYGLWRMRGKLLDIWRDQWSRFLLLQLGIYNLIVAIGRAQYGIGIMRAERYVYSGLLLVLLLLVRILRRWQIGRWGWIVPIIVSLQIAGFGQRANSYVVRPQQLKVLMSQIKSGEDEVARGEYLPYFVLNDQRLKYGDLYELMER